MAVASTTLETARSIVSLMSSRLPGGEVATGTDNLTRVDYAIKAAGDEFVRRTRCTILTDETLTLTADSEVLDTSGLTTFHPSRIVNIEVEHPTTGTVYPAQQVNYRYVRQARLNGAERYWWYPYTNSADQVGITDVFAWRDANRAIVAPLPGLAWKVLITYWVPFTSWTYGTASPGAVTLNIPDDMIHGVLNSGFRCYFNAASSPASASLDRSLFDKHIRECSGLYTANRSILANPEDYK